jgi:hypothetical protein
MRLYKKKRGLDYMHTLGEKYESVVKLTGIFQAKPHPDTNRLERN